MSKACEPKSLLAKTIILTIETSVWTKVDQLSLQTTFKAAATVVVAENLNLMGEIINRPSKAF